MIANCKISKNPKQFREGSEIYQKSDEKYPLPIGGNVSPQPFDTLLLYPLHLCSS